MSSGSNKSEESGEWLVWSSVNKSEEIAVTSQDTLLVTSQPC